MSARVPRLARFLLALLIPPDERRAILSDLDEEYVRHIRPVRGVLRARAWYWRQVIGSIPHAIEMRRRRSGLSDRLSLDVVLALRSLRRRPATTAAAVLTLGLGIGANTAIYSVVDAVLFRPLPFGEPDRLVRIWSANPRGIQRNAMSPPDFFDMRDGGIASGALTSAAAYTMSDATLRTGEPARVVVATVSSSFFETLGVHPSTGRVFQQADARSGAPAVAIVADQFWRSRLGARAVPFEVSVSGAAAMVVGVAPRGFAFPSPEVSFWTPLVEDASSGPRSAHYLDVIGRMPDAVTISASTAALQGIAAQLAVAHPESNRGWGITAVPLEQSLTGEVRRPLLLLLGAVACVLLIACANVAGLLLANGEKRSREFALRTAIGAAPSRLIATQLVESVLLAVFGAGVAVLLAYVGLGLLARTDIPLPRSETIALETRVLAVTAAIALLTGLLAGLAPALRASRANPEEALKNARSAGAGVAARRGRTMLVVMQIAVTFALTISAALLLKSYSKLTRVDPGFDADHVLLAQVSLAVTAYEPDRWAAYVSRALEELRTLPTVTSVGAASPLPLSGREGLMRFGVRIEGRPAPAEGQSDRTYLRWATAGYFAAIGIPVVSGRPFEDRDDGRAAAVAVVDRTFVERFFPGEEALGRKIVMSNERGRARTIIGVVGPVRQTGLDAVADPHVYIPHAQNPSAAMTFVVRSSAAPQGLAPLVRERLRAVDPSQPVYNIRTGREMIAGTIAGRSLNTVLVGVFADLAGLLTLVGLYGLMASWVAESKKEFGVRLALGARPRDVLTMVVGRGLRVTAVGIALGLPLAIAASGGLRSLLFEVPERDTSTYVMACAALLFVGAAASYLPARQATAASPVDSLRGE